MTLHTGRHFLQIPGPTNVPDRVLRAMDMPTMDHRGPEFAELGHAVLAGMQRIFRTKQPVIIYPSSGTGAWETSTSCVTHPLEVRKALNRTNHPALLMVDSISGLASLEYEHDAWGIDVSIAGSQKGMMLPPGLGFNALSEKALAAANANTSTRSYWDWHDMIAMNKLGTFPYTPATNLLFALKEAIAMLEEEGLDKVWARHMRHGAATRAAAKAWGLDLVCLDPHAYSSALTALMVPEGHDADAFRKVVLENFDMSLGTGLGKIKGKAFRIGHLGHFNDLMLMGTLSGVEMGLDLAHVPHRSGGVLAAMDVLKGRDVVPMQKAAVA
jgi:alanine-glyoxylate transaminase/serine-glyoxylate transaminase/serine-pyruvate transaminase